MAEDILCGSTYQMLRHLKRGSAAGAGTQWHLMLLKRENSTFERQLFTAISGTKTPKQVQSKHVAVSPKLDDSETRAVSILNLILGMH